MAAAAAMTSYMMRNGNNENEYEVPRNARIGGISIDPDDDKYIDCSSHVFILASVHSAVLPDTDLFPVLDNFEIFQYGGEATSCATSPSHLEIEKQLFLPTFYKRNIQHVGRVEELPHNSLAKYLLRSAGLNGANEYCPNREIDLSRDNLGNKRNPGTKGFGVFIRTGEETEWSYFDTLTEAIRIKEIKTTEELMYAFKHKFKPQSYVTIFLTSCTSIPGGEGNIAKYNKTLKILSELKPSSIEPFRPHILRRRANAPITPREMFIEEETNTKGYLSTNKYRKAFPPKKKSGIAKTSTEILIASLKRYYGKDKVIFELPEYSYLLPVYNWVLQTKIIETGKKVEQQSELVILPDSTVIYPDGALLPPVGDAQFGLDWVKSFFSNIHLLEPKQLPNGTIFIQGYGLRFPDTTMLHFPETKRSSSSASSSGAAGAGAGAGAGASMTYGGGRHRTHTRARTLKRKTYKRRK